MATVKATAVQDHPELGADPLALRIKDIFRSDRLRYRGVEPEDAEFMFGMRSTPEVELNAGGSSWPRPYTMTEAKDFVKILQGNVISTVIELDPDKEQPGLAEELRHPSSATGSSSKEGDEGRKSAKGVTKGVPIGIISLRSTFGASNAPVRTAELAINLLPAYQGRGYGAEAIRWIVDWGFEMAGLHRIRLACFSFNTQAIRAYDSIGFKRTGVDHEAIWLGGRWWDFITYGLLDREWAAVKDDRKKKGLRV